MQQTIIKHKYQVEPRTSVTLWQLWNYRNLKLVKNSTAQRVTFSRVCQLCLPKAALFTFANGCFPMRANCTPHQIALDDPRLSVFHHVWIFFSRGFHLTFRWEIPGRRVTLSSPPPLWRECHNQPKTPKCGCHGQRESARVLEKCFII